MTTDILLHSEFQANQLGQTNQDLSQRRAFGEKVPDPLLVAPVQEVFSSVQGEGVHVGKRQVFVRFAHCHLKCAYCDTPMQSATGQCFVETVPGHGHQVTLDNPVAVDVLWDKIQHLLFQARHHSVSFTGGEPLLYHRFLAELLPRVQSQCKTYLETSGTQPEFLASVLPYTDIIAMDIKLPSATKEAARYAEHAEFYRQAKTRSELELFVKLIFNDQTSEEELDAVRGIVTDSATPIILQPETSLADQTVRIDPKTIFRIENHLATQFSDIRVIPQTHKMLKVL